MHNRAPYHSILDLTECGQHFPQLIEKLADYQLKSVSFKEYNVASTATLHEMRANEVARALGTIIDTGENKCLVLIDYLPANTQL